MSDTVHSDTVQIPDFVVRQIGTLQLQLAAANEHIAQLEAALAAAQAPEASPETPAGT